MQARRYYVYVVALTPIGSTDDVYVGSSAYPPRVRLEHHLNPEPGKVQGSRHVYHRGLGLVPELYKGLNPFETREDARKAEHRLRARLERRGYRVYGSCYQTAEKDCWL